MGNRFVEILIGCVIAFSLAGCKKWPWQDCEKGVGDVYEDRHIFANFSTFQLDMPAEITIHPDTNRKFSEIVVLAQQNVAQNIKVLNNEGVVTVGFKGCFREHKEIEYHLYVHSLKHLIINSPTKIKTTKAILGSDVKVTFNNAGAMEGAIHVDQLNIDFKGSATVNLSGYARKQIINFDHPADYNASELITDSTCVKMNIGGTLQVYATSLLDVDMNAGEIKYKGEDTLEIIQNLRGSARLIEVPDTL